jgi:hypothetical protein
VPTKLLTGSGCSVGSHKNMNWKINTALFYVGWINISTGNIEGKIMKLLKGGVK